MFSNIKLKPEIVKFNKKFESVLYENKWNNQKFLIDATMEHPGML